MLPPTENPDVSLCPFQGRSDAGFLIAGDVKTFYPVLEAVEALSPDEQENLVSLVQRLVREKRRAELVRALKAA